MKRLLAIAALFTGVLLTACDKKDVLPHYNDGKTPVVTASSTNVAPAPADSNNVALTLTWSAPAYATDSSKTKYVVEIDSAGKSFSKPLSKTVTGARSVSFTAKELNMFLVNRAYAFGKAVTMQARVTSSYGNNNERLQSDPLTINMTPYKVPPKVALPTTGRLFIVGDASEFGWSNDPAPPTFPVAREFTRVDETTWVGIFNFKGGGAYKLLQEQGVWGSQFHMLAGGDATSGSFEQKDADPAFSGPSAAGLYKVTVDFQQGTYRVAPFTQQHGLPDGLFLVGDATPGDWANPVPVPSQQFTRLTSTKFELTIPLVANKKYLILPENGNWGKKFGGDGSASNTPLSGALKPEGADMPSPTVSGTYKITVDFSNNNYTLVKQ